MFQISSTSVNSGLTIEVASVILSVISFASGVTLRKSADTKNYLVWPLQVMMFFYIASDYSLTTVFVTLVFSFNLHHRSTNF